MNKSFLKTLAISLLLLSIFIGNTADACRAKMDPWFITKTTINESTLPPGVTFTGAGFVDDGKSDGKFTNSSTTPFYLLYSDLSYYRTYPDYKDLGPFAKNGQSTGLTDHAYPSFKFVSNEVYAWSFDAGWLQIDPNSTRASTNIKSSEFFYSIKFDSFGDAIVTEPDNKYYGKRPKDVTIPEPKEFSLAAYYGTARVSIEGKFDYALKKDYVDRSNYCNDMIFVTWFIFLFWIIVIAITPIVLYRSIKKRTTNKLVIFSVVIIGTILSFVIANVIAASLSIYFG